MAKKEKRLIDTYPDFDDFLLEELKNTEIAKGYLEACFMEYMEDGDKKAFLYCLKPLVQAQGSISDFARKVGINRTYLYKIFGNKINPDFSTIIKIIDSLGFELSFNIKKHKLAN